MKKRVPTAISATIGNEASGGKFQPYSEYKDSGIPWLGKLPAHWEMRKLRRLLKSIEQGWSPVAEDREAREEEWAVIKLSAIHAGIFNDREHKALPFGLEAPPALEIHPGDLLLTRANTPDLVGDVCLVQRTRRRLLMSDLVYRLTPVGSPEVCAQFLLYWLLSRSGRYQIQADSRGSSKSMVKISQGHIKSWVLPLPPLSEQIAIAAFLDNETAKLDELAASKKRLIELLQENRAALVTQAVTRGLDLDVFLKSAGSGFLPSVPPHWVVRRVKDLCRDIADGPHFSPQYVDDGIMFMSARNVKVNAWSLEDVKYISSEDYRKFCRRVIPERGDVLYTKGGTTGIARVVDFDAPFHVWVHIAVLKAKEKAVDPFWFAYALNGLASYGQSQLYTRGATNNDLGLTRLANIILAVPPLEEQRQIVEFLDHSTSRIDMIITRMHDGIARLRELHASLISAAVTGKIDVREESA